MNNTVKTLNKLSVDEEEQRYLDFLPEIAGSNLNPKTLLATDYLNLFNEVIMLLEISIDMPEMLEECRNWKPKSYKQHFRDSHIADKEIAIKAYDYVPSKYKKPFEDAVVQISFIVIKTLQNADKALAKHDLEEFKFVIARGLETIKSFSSIADGIIHGSEKTMSQDEIDIAYKTLGVTK
ncbi:MAG: hypothetical protein BWY78_00895 [Alphaproteobacteria bacterium ADurb.Bin438]|nr:MAG: hypothetical protein BWY78_00895 [Alphaproteobacteria bacterium ADurb.Bin438]